MYSPQRARQVILLLMVILLLVCLLSLKSGAIDTSFKDTFNALFQVLGLRPENATDRQLSMIMEQIRIPRLLLGILVGGSLAMSGAIMQALFRNPMADPGLLGVSSGAALGAVTIIVLGLKLFPSLYFSLGATLLPLFAFFGGLVTLVIVFKLATSRNRIDVPTMLLAGVAMNAITGALIGLLSYVADDAQLRDLIFWSLGSLEITDWSKLNIALLIILPAMLFMLSFANALNANLLGENEARHLGIDIDKVKSKLIIMVSIIVGVAVALSGIIGFVGLLVPHLLRLLVGPDHRILLPASAIFGAILLVLADIIARTIVSPAEIPIGIITAILGGPFFLWLLVRHRKNQAA